MSDSSSSLAPISQASIVIGFISFSFTLAIWLHAFWKSFKTLGAAPREARDMLSTLRQGLYEEREYLKRLRRRRMARGIGDGQGKGDEGALYIEGGPVKVFSDAVKDLIRDFKILERPFLIPPYEGVVRERELEWSYDATQHHYSCDLPHRLYWLRNKNNVMSISEQLNTIQTRRIAVEIAECHV